MDIVAFLRTQARWVEDQSQADLSWQRKPRCVYTTDSVQSEPVYTNLLTAWIIEARESLLGCR